MKEKEQQAKVDSYAAFSDEPRELRSEWGAHDWGWTDGASFMQAQLAARDARIAELVRQLIQESEEGLHDPETYRPTGLAWYNGRLDGLRAVLAALAPEPAASGEEGNDVPETK